MEKTMNDYMEESLVKQGQNPKELMKERMNENLKRELSKEEMDALVKKMVRKF